VLSRNLIPVRAYSEALADGDAGVEQTVRGSSRARSMIGLIDRGKKDPQVRGMAAQIIRAANVPAFDFRGEFRAIFEWVKRNIRWTRDPTNKEGIQDAATTLQWGIGDCDCISILICSLLGSIGARTRLVTISNHADAPEDFSHIYPEVRLDGRWIPVDAGRRAPAWGKGPSRWFRRRNWDVDTGEYEDVHPAVAPNSGAMAGLGRRSLGGGGMRRLGSFNTPNWRASMHGRRMAGLRRLGRLRGFGQDPTDTGWDWSQFETQLPALITSVTTGTSNIIRASNAPQVAAANPYAILAQQNPALLQQSINPFGSLFANPTMLLLIGGGILAAIAFSRHND
jgi:transglutaminase superfamily protein